MPVATLLLQPCLFHTRSTLNISFTRRPICAGAGRWGEAVGYYDRAYKLSPQFAFAGANRALALYQAGEEGRAVKEMR